MSSANSANSMNREQLKRRAIEILRDREQSRKTLLGFTKYTMPDYDVNWHHRVITSACDRLINGSLKRLMVFVHPRSGKSELVSRRLPAFYLGQHPDNSVIACSYSATLASRMNRDVQRIMDSQRYSNLFPETKLPGSTKGKGFYSRTKDLLEVVGRKGAYRSAGVGGSIVGMGFNLGIIDDPIKGAEEARSPLIRDNQWEWYTGDFFTRCAPGARILITLTRWHHDDICGRILKQVADDKALGRETDEWEVIRLPAIAESPAQHESDKREEGEALWPSRFPLAELVKIRQVMGVHQFGAIYQQRPTPKEGGLFKFQHFSRTLTVCPSDAVLRVRYWDKGYATKGDYTVGCRMSKRPDKTYCIEDVVRLRCSPLERNEAIKAVAERDDVEFDKRIPQVIEQPPGAGSETTSTLVRFLAGHIARIKRPTGSKEERAESVAAQLEAGNVSIIFAPWNRDFIDECCAFPGAAHDDCVDALSGAFLELVNARTINVGI